MIQKISLSYCHGRLTQLASRPDVFLQYETASPIETLIGGGSWDGIFLNSAVPDCAITECVLLQQDLCASWPLETFGHTVHWDDILLPSQNHLSITTDG